LDTSRLRVLVAGHLSQQNNSSDHAFAALATVADHHQAEVHMASQDSGSDWFSVANEEFSTVSDAVGS